MGDHVPRPYALLRCRGRSDGRVRGWRRLAHLPLRARPSQPGAGPPLARLLAHAVRRLLAADRAPARPRRGPRSHADHVRLPPAARRDQHHHGRVRYLRALLRLHLLARHVLSRLQSDRRSRRARVDRRLRLHDVAPLAGATREARLPARVSQRDRRAPARPCLAARRCAVPLGAAPDRGDGLPPGRRAPRHGPTGLGAVVAGRLGARPDFSGAWHGRSRSGGNTPGPTGGFTAWRRWPSSRRFPGPRRST